MTNPANNPPVETDAFFSSREKAKNGYGQNGYQGPSSDLPGQATRSDRDYTISDDPVVDAARAGFGEGANWQTRNVSKEPYKTAHGMKGPSEPAKVPDGNIRRPRVQAAPGTFQR